MNSGYHLISHPTSRMDNLEIVILNMQVEYI